MTTTHVIDPATEAAPTPEVTRVLSTWVADLAHDDIPTEVRERMAVLFADTLGIVLGAQELDSTEAMVEGLERAGLLGAATHGPGAVVAPGRADRWTAYGSALLTSAAAHSLDFDDTHAPSQIHPGSPIIGAALAAAQVAGCGGRTLLTGLVAGYEVMTRVSYGLVPLSHSDHGWHLSATTGVFGAAAAAGRILGLTAEQLEAAFGTALSQTAGAAQFLVNGAWTKRFHVGHASAGGFLAASLAGAGYTGAAQAFEGDNGFFRLYSPAPVPAEAVAGLGEVWETMGVAVKPYPCCRAIHAPLDATLAIVARTDIDPTRISSVRVGMPRKCVDITGAPQDRKRDPQNVVDCQFSAHLCVATALTHGRLTFADYEPALADPQIRALMQRIDAYVDEEAEAAYPTVFPGRIEVTFDDGRVETEYAAVPLGEPDNMLAAPELEAKVLGLAGGLLGPDRARALLDTILGMDRDDTPIDELMALTLPSAG